MTPAGASLVPSEERRAVLALALVVFVLVVAHVTALYAPNTWINRDGRFYTNMNVTLVENLSLDQGQFAASWYSGELGWNRNLDQGWSNVSLGRNDERWPKHPWLMPVLSTPLYFAFGLPGTLLFNLLVFSIIAGAGYRFTREYASPSSAAMAVATLLLGTAVHEYAYDYHVDVLLLGLFASALAALATRHGKVLGALVGLMLLVKPTSLLLLPALLLLLWERRDLGALKGAVLGGGAVLAVAACVNTYMFGRPWWFGYSRILIVVAGEPTVAAATDAFSVPLEEGMRRVFGGHWGLRQRQTLMVLAFPGLLGLLSRRPAYALAALGTGVASFLVFSKYQYEGDRFHWPALALLLPALAASFDLLGSSFVSLHRRLTGLVHRRRGSADAPTSASAQSLGPATIAALLCMAAVVATLPFGRPATDRLGDGPYVTGALALGEHGTLDLRDVIDEDELLRSSGALSMVARSRFGHFLPRASPPAVFLAAPFAAMGGRPALIVLHLLAAALAVFGATRFLSHVARPEIAAVVAVGPFLLPWMRDGVIIGGPELLSAPLAMLALWLTLERRWAAAGALAVGAAWMADAPWLFGLAVVAVSLGAGTHAMRRAIIGTVVVLTLWGAGHLLLIGRPFASPNDFVIAEVMGAVRTVEFHPGSPLEALELITNTRVGTPLLLLLLLCVPGTLLAARRRMAAAALMVAGLLSLLAPGTLATGSPADVQNPVVLFVLILPLAPLAEQLAWRLSRAAGAATGRQKLAAVVATAAALLVIGGARQVRSAAEPFHLGSERAMRSATVLLDDRIPCDFIPWEHMSWECSHYDRGHFNQVGLALPEGVVVGGEPTGMLLIPTGRGRQDRTVRWSDIPATSQLSLSYAVPDRQAGGSRVTVLVDGEEVGAFDAPARSDGAIHSVDFDTSPYAGRRVELTLRASAPNPAAVVGVDGGFVTP